MKKELPKLLEGKYPSRGKIYKEISGENYQSVACDINLEILFTLKAIRNRVAWVVFLVFISTVCSYIK